MAQAGIANVVAVMGASCSEEQAALIQHLVPEEGRKWLLPDGDQAGERMGESALMLLSPYRFVRWVKIGEGKQPTDMGPERAAKILPMIPHLFK